MGVWPFEPECREKQELWWSNMDLGNSHRIIELLEEILIQLTELKQAHMHLDYPHLLFA